MYYTDRNTQNARPIVGAGHVGTAHVQFFACDTPLWKSADLGDPRVRFRLKQGARQIKTKRRRNVGAKKRSENYADTENNDWEYNEIKPAHNAPDYTL